MNKEQRDLIKQLGKKVGIDARTAREIAYYPLKFTKRIMESADDEAPIRIRYFGLFKQKNIKTKAMVRMFNECYKELKEHPEKVQLLIDAGFDVTGDPLKWFHKFFNRKKDKYIVSKVKKVHKTLFSEPN